MERRTLPRFTPERPLTAKVRAYIPARVLDISLGGTQVELSHSLPPRATCDLRFQVNGSEVVLRGTVRRCRVWKPGSDEMDHRVLYFRAGIEFDEPSRQKLSGLGDDLLGSHVLWVRESDAGKNATGAPEFEVVIDDPEGAPAGPKGRGPSGSR